MQPGADRDRRAARPAAGRERAREPVREEVEPRLRHSGERGEPLDRGVEQRRLGERQLARADHPEHDAVERTSRRRRRAGAPQKTKIESSR